MTCNLEAGLGAGKGGVRYKCLGVQEAADEVARLVRCTVAALLCGPRSGEAAAAEPRDLAAQLTLSKDISDAWMACKGSLSALAESSNLDAGCWRIFCAISFPAVECVTRQGGQEPISQMQAMMHISQRDS